MVDGLSLDGAVGGGAGDDGQFGELARGMCLRAVHVHEVTLRGRRQSGLCAAKVGFGFGHLHPFTGSGAAKVGFELGYR